MPHASRAAPVIPHTVAPSREPEPAAVRGVVADPARPSLVFQPIVDLAQGVVAGYETLARFGCRLRLPPDRWLAAAQRHGVGSLLEARIVQKVLHVKSCLPPNTFVTVNVSPTLLVDDQFARLLDDGQDLSRIVFELTEHERIDDVDPVLERLDRARGMGAKVAMDDVGSGYSGLRWISLVRPEFVKLDRSLVRDAHRDEVKLALAELLGEFVGRLDGWLVAEGIESEADLEAFGRLGVPLGQGWLFGRSVPWFAGVHSDLTDRIRQAARQRMPAGDCVVSVVERAVTVPAGMPEAVRRALAVTPRPEALVVLDARARPVQLMLPAVERSPAGLAVHPVMTVAPADSVQDVARRAMTRDRATRFDPVLCTDACGELMGIVRIERLVGRLAHLGQLPVKPPALSGVTG